MIPLLLLAAGCLLDGPYKHDFGTVPEDLGDGWPIATPEEAGLDPALLDEIHTDLLREDAHFATLGLLIAKDGALVFETWLRDPADRDHVHHLQSATKSFTSIATGIARDQGLITDIDVPMCDLLGDACASHPDKRGVTLRHLLTMRSGIDLDNDHMAYDMLIGQPDDPLDFLLDRPMFADPGEQYYYRDADPQLMAYVLEAVAGQREAPFLDENLFTPLGFEEWYWEPLWDGQTTGAFGLHLRLRDLAKLGQMVLDRGKWKGERIVSEAWLDEALTPHVPDAGGGLAYGYYWWIFPEGEAYTAWGHGGQYAMFVPSENLLVVQVARPDGALHGSDPHDLYDIVRPLWE